MAADVRDFGAVQRATSQIVAELGRIDVLVASAGMADQSSITAAAPAGGGPWWRPTCSAWRTACGPSRRRWRGPAGDIVVIASASGRDTYVGEPLYIASKWGVVGMGHAVRKELAASNIRVTLIEPGLVDTPLTRGSPVVRPLVEAGGALLPDDIAEAVDLADLAATPGLGHRTGDPPHVGGRHRADIATDMSGRPRPPSGPTATW